MNRTMDALNFFTTREQFRMHRLQVFNWGTFDGLHNIPIAERGFLFVGRSGSGKTTLLDAFSALLVPPRWIDFNAAAREATRRGRDRNLITYVRGAWSEQKDNSTGEIVTRYLRAGTTWSALALTFRSTQNRVVTLVGIFWLRGNTASIRDARRHYIIFERPFDLAELSDFQLDLRRVKQTFPDGKFYENFNPYCERFRRILSIESEMALRLLHKTQSAKSLGDLNVFLRDFMLDTPGTFAVADTLVSEFGELSDAHQAVVTAREQVSVLSPARLKHERLQDVAREISVLEGLEQGIDIFRDEEKIRFVTEKLQQSEVRLKGLNSEIQQDEGSVEIRRRTVQDLKDQHLRLGGDRISRLEDEKKDREDERARRMAKRNQLSQACDRLKWELPETPGGFAALIGRANQEFQDYREQSGRLRTQREELAVQRHDAEKTFKETIQEVESLERQPSNIPRHMLALRKQIAVDLAISEEAIPFAGELIEVLPEEAGWRGAIERVLHGFALSLLVDERHYFALSGYVNENHLGRRLVYYRTGPVLHANQSSFSPDSLPGKMRIKEGRHAEWLMAELALRFNYVCVDSVKALQRHDRALTAQGQVRHGKTRHEKDDRHSIDDPGRWVLGFDNRDKLALFKKRAQALAGCLEDFNRQGEDLREKEALGEQRAMDCKTLVNIQWEEIDVAPMVERIDAIVKQLEEIRSGNASLQQIGKRIEQESLDLRRAEGDLREKQLDAGQVIRDIQEKTGQLNSLQAAIAGRTLTSEKRQGLTEKWNAMTMASPTLDNIDKQMGLLERKINSDIRSLSSERHTLEKEIENRFSDFKRRWPTESSDLDDTLASAADYLAKLQRLEVDGLPAYEKRFFDLLRDQSHQNLASLNSHLRHARSQIRERMEMVNEGLTQAAFNRGTYLRIDVTDRQLAEVQDFKRDIQEALSHAWLEDREAAERRFGILRRLVERLADSDPQQQRWRTAVLDVRQHVEFIGRELDADGNEIEIYRSGAGKSGGQRQKLATTCLAAALRYQLSGADHKTPAYAPVILDEAFDKADNEFTALAMNIFTSFGFQMVVATPLKSVMTLEPFIGGACYVDIDERQHSGVLLIEYDDAHQRLNFPEKPTDDKEIAVSGHGL